MSEREVLKIMEAFSDVDEELLARSEATGRKKRGLNKSAQAGFAWRYLSRCAAVFALIVVGFASWRGNMVMKSSDLAGSVSGETPQDNRQSSRYEMAGGAGEESYFPDGSDALGGTIPQQSDTVGDSTVTAESLAGTVGETNEEPPSAGAIAGSEQEKNVWTESSDNRRGGDPGKEESEFDGVKTESELIADKVISRNKQSLTEAEARALDELGDYVPVNLPEGYVFESAGYYPESEELSLCWHRGMDSIVLSIRKVDEDSVEIADVSKPESYDERLYEIPYGDKIPGEYWNTFQSPVFAKSDFSLEIVRSRVLSYNGDAGDTLTPRGNFAVLYGGVLVKFNGRGTPEQIWEMFDSIP